MCDDPPLCTQILTQRKLTKLHNDGDFKGKKTLYDNCNSQGASAYDYVIVGEHFPQTTFFIRNHQRGFLIIDIEAIWRLTEML